MKQILWLKTLIWGFIAGVLAGLAMLLTMALLRLFLGWPTPTELIFDRVFPLLTVEFFIGSLVRAGGYTPLKLQGVFGALTAQVIVAGLGGVLYAFYLKHRDRRGGLRPVGNSLLDARGLSLIIPGVQRSSSSPCFGRRFSPITAAFRRAPRTPSLLWKC